MRETGIELARRFYTERVAPELAGVPHAAALLGSGSEVLGFDDEVSPDHDFGPRVQVFTEVPVSLPAGAAVTTAGRFFAGRLGVDPGTGMSLTDWLVSPTQILAGLTGGAVFHDPAGELASRRDALRWYPGDVWRYALAAGWLKVAQEEAFVARAGSTGDDLGSRILAARLARELIRLCFLVERRWAPYAKWLGRAFGELALAGRVAPLLAEATGAGHWRDREAALGAAAGVVAAATNELDLCAPVDPAVRQFHDRDIRVLGAERFTVALTAAITDPEVRALLARLGVRRDTAVGALPGTVDQAVDSTDVLSNPARFRAAAPMLRGRVAVAADAELTVTVRSMRPYGYLVETADGRDGLIDITKATEPPPAVGDRVLVAVLDDSRSPWRLSALPADIEIARSRRRDRGD